MHDVVARPSSICDESNDCRDYATYCDFAIHFCPCLISAHPPESLRRFSNAATFGSLLNSAHVRNPERRRRMIVSRLILGKRAITSSSENFSPSTVYVSCGITTNLSQRAVPSVTCDGNRRQSPDFSFNLLWRHLRRQKRIYAVFNGVLNRAMRQRFAVIAIKERRLRRSSSRVISVLQ